MPANFTSGWLGNSERAWHGMGVVTEGTLPAREAFETAEALFTVEKRELRLPIHSEDGPDGYLPGKVVYQPTGTFGVVRTDTQATCLVSSVSSTKLSRTIVSFGWQSSSAKRLTWTASSFYRTVPRSALPPHSVVRRRTSSLVTQSNDASLATSDTMVRPAVVQSSPTSVLSVKTL